MDPTLFDNFTRTLTDARSRRGALTAVLGGTLGLLGLAETAAKKGKHVHGEGKKKKKKKKKKKAPVPTTQTPVSPPPPPSCSDCAGGRTCQAGTCACPAAKPKVCPGSTICRQCCVKADCTFFDEITPSVPECATDGVCVCATAGTRFCGGLGFCGSCCSHAECTGGSLCDQPTPGAAYACVCRNTDVTCVGAGRTGCVPDTAICRNACGTSCNPEDGDAACPCAANLVCDFDPAVQDGYYCAPR